MEEDVIISCHTVVKKLNKLLLFIFSLTILLNYSTCYGVDIGKSTSTTVEGRYEPLKVAEKHGDYVYLSKIDYHNYLVQYSTESNKEIKRIPIRIKYYYNIKNNLLFLGEDNIFYWADNHASKTKVLLKNIKEAVSTDEEGEYAYALNDSGELYRITADGKKIEKVCSNVMTLYSAWNDWVVYQTADKLWWKHTIGQKPVQVGHKGEQKSPYIPSTTIGSSIPSYGQDIIGPWRMIIKNKSVAGNWHGGGQLYDDYKEIFIEHKDGMNEAVKIVSTMDYMLSNPKIIKSSENEIYINSVQVHDTPKQIDGDYFDYFEDITCISNNNEGRIKIIYQKEIGKKGITDSFYWTPNGFYIISANKKNISWISLNMQNSTEILQSQGTIAYIKTIGDEIFFKEISPETINYYSINIKNNDLRKVEGFKEENAAYELKDWKISIVKENRLYQKNMLNHQEKMIQDTEGQGIWLFSKGILNYLYLKGNSIFITRNGKTAKVCDFELPYDTGFKGSSEHIPFKADPWLFTIEQEDHRKLNFLYMEDNQLYIYYYPDVSRKIADFENISSLRENTFSLDGWIYTQLNDGKYLRFQPDNPSIVQKMSCRFDSPIYHKDYVVGFYNDSLCKYLWANSKIETLSKINRNGNGFPQLIETDERYVFSDNVNKKVISILKTGKGRMDISENQPLAMDFRNWFTSDIRQIWYMGGYIYFISESNGGLYRVQPNGKSFSKIISGFNRIVSINKGFIFHEIYNESKNTSMVSLVQVNSLGKQKQVVLQDIEDKRLNGACNIIDIILNKGTKLVIAQLSQANPDSDFPMLTSKVFFSLDSKNPNKKILYINGDPNFNKYCIIDQHLYFTNDQGHICSVSLEGKNSETLH